MTLTFNTHLSYRPLMVAGVMLLGGLAHAFTPSTTPAETQAVPGNMLLALSVEWPTGVQVSYTASTYTAATEYLGYFDNRKCYEYNTSQEVFKPVSKRNTDLSCSGETWSGNVLNWLTMANLDQFRSVMTGGTRDSFTAANALFAGDTADQTVLIRAFSDRKASGTITVVKQLPSATAREVPTARVGHWARSGGYGYRFFTNATDSFSDMNAAQQREICSGRTVNTGLECFNIRVLACLPVGSGSSYVGPESSCSNGYPLANYSNRYWQASTAYTVGDAVRVGSANDDPYAGKTLKATAVTGPSGTSAPDLASAASGSTVTDGGVTWTVATFVQKPEGLMQSNANKIRFGAVGYLNDTGKTRQGGVLRATMRSVGTILIGEGGGTNTSPEWSTTTGVISSNPTPSDDTGVTNSGVINYLNKFGYTSGYKGNDPVGEMYYASQLYYRNQSFPSAYTNLTSAQITAGQKDGFPVITTFPDPIVQTCQKNFILGIGDIFTHCDGLLPGTPDTGMANCSEQGGVPPTDAAVNVGTLYDTIKGYEDAANSWTLRGMATKPGPYWTGLAWWANVTDIRTDLLGKQTIQTFWVDTLENNNSGYGIGAKSTYYLATKYGGFKPELLTSGSNPNTLRNSWDKDANGIPDSLFAGNSPETMRTNLKAAFDEIISRADDSSASAAAVTSKRQTTASQILYAGYNPKYWTGGLRACSPSQTAQQCQDSPVWEATNWFDTTVGTVNGINYSSKLTNSNRKIFTSTSGNSTDITKMAFSWSSLNTGQQTVLNASDSLGSDRVDYLRGSRAREGSPFRIRGADMLGDIVNSNVTDLMGPGPGYRGTKFTNHATFRTANLSRPATVYVGGNDGMLHAFSGTNGKELWAYVPGSVFNNLPLLSASTYTHRYFVDSTAMVADTETGDTSAPWRTMLVGGLGGGGRGYYALDITRQTPDSVTTKSFANMTEAELKDIPMWEFTSAQDADLGYTYNEPSVDALTGAFLQINKVADTSNTNGVFRVIVGNGYGTANNKAILFFLNSETGNVATKLAATNTSTTDNGLSSPLPVDTDRDGLIDTVYAGDLLGSLHKFQFSKLAANGTDYEIAVSGDSNGAWRYIGSLYSAGQPITAAPVAVKACTGTSGWQVLFGTGKLVEDTDFTSSAVNSFYSVNDSGPSSTMTVASTLLASITYTQSTVTIGSVRNWTAPSLTGKKGWKVSFPAGERVISNPTLPPDSGAVLFGTAKPSGNLCDPGSAGFLMSVNICSAGIGSLTIATPDGETVVGGFGVSASGILKVSNTYTNSVNQQQVVCNQSDCQRGSGGGIVFKGLTAPKGRYSFREIINRTGN